MDIDDEKESTVDDEEMPYDDTVDDEEEYVVEAIRDWRYNLREKKREYLIKWKGYAEHENTWEPEDNLNCPHILEKYVDSLPTKRFRYWASDTPEDLSGFQRNATYRGCIGVDGPHESDSEDSSKKDKQSFYCLLLFDDSDFAEEVPIKEFMAHEPEEAWKFIESRMYFNKTHYKKQMENKNGT